MELRKNLLTGTMLSFFISISFGCGEKPKPAETKNSDNAPLSNNNTNSDNTPLDNNAKNYVNGPLSNSEKLSAEYQSHDSTHNFKEMYSLAMQGNAKAQHRIAFMYSVGLDTNYSQEKAVEWYQKSAAQGFAEAQCDLGHIYEKGDIVEKNYEEAMKWYRKAADQGLAKAQIYVGEMYEKGTGVPENYEEAMKWYRKAAVAGDFMGETMVEAREEMERRGQKEAE